MKSQLIINPEAGTIDRAFKSGKVRKNVGTIATNGYIQIRVDYKLEYAHRVIWESVNGKIPDGMVIDHINGNTTDNRILNLRLVTQSENMQNTRGARADNNTSKIKGVTFDKRRKKWIAQIFVDGKHHYLGQWDSKEEAAKAYSQGASTFHTCNPHSELSIA